jgi:hypothetical protein
MMHMKSLWGVLHRIRLGPKALKPDGPLSSGEAVKWCLEHCIDDCFHSPAYEVFYFKNPADATVFKLAWFNRT